MKLTFFDTETTGLPDREPFLSSPEHGPEIVEYAFAEWEDGSLGPVSHHYVKPRNLHLLPPPDEEGTYRTLDGFPLRYRADEWKHAKAVCWNADDSKRVHLHLARRTLAGSNPGFDAARVDFEVARFGGGFKRVDWDHRMVGTEHLGVFLLHQGLIQSRGLGALAEYFGVEHEDAHTAAGDLVASVKVFECLVELYHFRPERMREALETIAECSPDPDMAEFAAKAARGESDE